MRAWLVATTLFALASGPVFAQSQVQSGAANAASSIVYRCSTNGTVLYTNVPSPGCVVLSTPSSRAASTNAKSNAIIGNGTYVNSYGQTIRRPAYTTNGQAPAGASAQCADGSYSFSAHRRGTCSHHGGVAQWVH